VKIKEGNGASMAFTQDELQALNNIFDQKMAILQHELEQSLNQRMQVLKREFEDVVERILTAQLINQRLSAPVTQLSVPYTNESRPNLEAIEVQTEIAWEDLTELIDKILMERLAALNVSLQSKMQEMERALTARIRQWRDSTHYTQSYLPHERSTDNLTNIHASIEQLERLMESMQVVMTTNSALLANRLYHHQQLPLERAHPSRQENNTSLHSSDKEHAPISLPEDT
jgi:hypothetical protein